MFMRSCIYCGKELAPGEKCSCAASEARRRASENASNGAAENNEAQTNDQAKTEHTEDYKYNDPNRTTYRTGYTHTDGKFKRAREKARARKSAHREYRAYSGGSKAFWREQWNNFLSALRSPVEAVQNPKRMGMGLMVGLWALQGALMWLCVYFIMTNVPRGPFAMLGNLLALRGAAGYRTLGYMLMYVLSGAVGGVMMFFLYTGVFYGVNRLIFRDRSTSYTSLCERLAVTAVPLAAAAIIGTALSFISSTTLLILLLCGITACIVLTYEALKTQWSYIPSGRVVYGMLLGFFIIFTIICYIVRLS
jgi:hypothetical protein